MSWYRVGTITVTNGSTTVTGSGTAWIANAGVGEALYAPDGRLYEIAAIVSNTQLTLGSAYLGSTQSGQAYVIVPSQSYIRDLAAQAADLVNNYATVYNTVGQGKFPDGTLANPGIRFNDDLDTGFYRSGTNEVTFVAGGVAQFKYNTSGISFTTAPTFTTPTIFNVNSASTALRITQTGAGNALVVEDSANPDSTPFVVNADGKVLIASQTQIAALGGRTSALQYNSVDATPPATIFASFYSGTQYGTEIQFVSSKSGTAGTFGGAVASGQLLGSLKFFGDDGTSAVGAAQIFAEVDGTPGTNDMPGRLVFSTTADGASSPTERMRIDSAGRVGIGAGTAAGLNVNIAPAITGATTTYSVINQGTINSDVTAAANIFTSAIGTQATAFTLSNVRHFYAFNTAIGAGSTVTNQFGFHAEQTLVNATNNYGFFSNIPSGTGRWNFYANGSADNYFAGRIGIGGVADSFTNVYLSRNITGATLAYGILQNAFIQSDVTGTAILNSTGAFTAAAAFTLYELIHYGVAQGTFGAGSAVTNQYGFNVSSSLTGATNNYGFFSNIASGTGRWNFYANGTAANYFGGNVIQKLAASVTPANNSEMMMELTSNTSLTIKVKGTDGVVRSVSLTLA